MNVDAIILSEAAILTDDNKSLSILRTLNAMSTPGFPANLPSMALSLIIHAHPSERGSTHKLDIKMLNERREVIVRLVEDYPFTLPSGTGPPVGIPLRFHYVHRMVNVQFENPGAYAFEVYVDGTYVAGTAFHIARAEGDGQG